MLRTLPFILLLVACKKAPTAESCGKLTATIEGKSIGDLTYGLAHKAHDAYEVAMFNIDKTKCADVLNPNGRVIPDGEVSVEAFAGGDGMMSKGVVYDANTLAGDNVSASLVGDAPKAKGDKVQICVQDATIEIGFGKNQGKKLVLNGLFTGTYCGGE
jgi:hypothetical protein